MKILMDSRIDYSNLRKQYILDDDIYEETNNELNDILEKYYKDALFNNLNTYKELFRKITNINIEKIDNKVNKITSLINEQISFSFDVNTYSYR
jgi:hypothetical protein